MIYTDCKINGTNYRVKRETVIRVGADWQEFPNGQMVDVVSVNDVDNGIVILPTEDVFQIAKNCKDGEVYNDC